MVAGIVGPAAVLFDDNPFRIPRAAAYFRVHIVLPVMARRKPTLAIPKLTPSDIAWQGFAMPSLKPCQEVMCLLRRGLFMPDFPRSLLLV
jgi:hypothetical protein